MKNVVLTIAILTSITSAALAGGTVGNGGNVVVCKGPSGQIISTEVFDLYEGRTLKGLTYLERSAPFLKQALILANKLSHATGSAGSAESFASDVESTFKTFKFLPTGTGLKPIDDGAEVILPKSCQKMQTANRQDSETILVDSDIWKILSNTQKAALILHETVYRHLQRAEAQGGTVEKDSARARRLVAHLFSGGSLEPIYSFQKYAVGKTLFCNTNKEDMADVTSTYFTVYQEADKGVTAEFQQWLNHKVLTRTTVKNYLPNGLNWPPSGNQILVISGDLVSPVESQTKATLKFTSALAGEIWFNERGVKTTSEKFECYER